MYVPDFVSEEAARLVRAGHGLTLGEETEFTSVKWADDALGVLADIATEADERVGETLVEKATPEKLKSLSGAAALPPSQRQGRADNRVKLPEWAHPDFIRDRYREDLHEDPEDELANWVVNEATDRDLIEALNREIAQQEEYIWDSLGDSVYDIWHRRKKS